MNNQRRKQLKEIEPLLDQIKEILEQVTNEEQDAFDNMPESLQYSSRGEAMEEAINYLEDAANAADELQDALNNLIG